MMDPLSRRTLRLGVVIGVAMIGLSLYFESWSISLGVGAGAVLSLGNFLSIQRVVRNQFREQQPRFILGIYVLKMGLIFGVLFALIQLAGLNAIAIMAGLSASVIAGIIGGASGCSDEDTADVNEGPTAGESLDG